MHRGRVQAAQLCLLRGSERLSVELHAMSLLARARLPLCVAQGPGMFGGPLGGLVSRVQCHGLCVDPCYAAQSPHFTSPLLHVHGELFSSVEGGSAAPSTAYEHRYGVFVSACR